MDKVPVFYLFLHRKLVVTSRKNARVNVREVLRIVGRAYNVPKHIMFCVLKELESFGLVRFENRLFLKVTNREASVGVDDVSGLLRQAGIQYEK